MSSYKLGVEVVSAHDLMPKDGHGSATPFVELYFDHQKVRTTTKEKDVNPVWNECFYFNISDPSQLPALALEAYVYNLNLNGKSFLGKVRIAGTSFVPYSDAVVMHYPLEKRGLFSHVKGELGLKVFITDDPSVKASDPFHEVDPLASNHPPRQHEHKTSRFVNAAASDVTLMQRPHQRHAFHTVPKEAHGHYAHHSSSYADGEQYQQMKYAPPEQMMKPESRLPRIVRMFSAASQQPAAYMLKETSPMLGGGQIVGGRVIHANKPARTYDLVEQMNYLFVRVVKARDLPGMNVTGSLDPYVEVIVGNYRGSTRYFQNNQNPEWNVVFAFSRDRLQASVLEVVVKDKNLVKDDIVGMLLFDLNDVPTRVPPDSPLAPEWYHLLDLRREKTRGELMLAIWMGTQADEAFPDAWHSDAAVAIDASVVRAKVYHAPRLWYVRVNVIEAQDIVVTDKSRFPSVYVKAQLGHHVARTRPVQAQNLNPFWNEDIMFVAAEPFEDALVFTLEDHVSANQHDILGQVIVPLTSVEKRADDRFIHDCWFNLERHVAIDLDQLKKDKFATRLRLRVCLDGGYHVLDESTQYSSDLRPTAKQLWKPPIGVLELGILGAEGLHPMKTRDSKGTTDAYCVVKYGHKWVRSRTIIDSLSPKFNEQYTWEVFDPATVLTVGMFDNCQLGEHGSNGHRDSRIGKVRIRLSTLETGRVYTHSYPLLVLHPSGLKKMGELHLAIRFVSSSLANMLYLYSRPLLPKMHYVRPLTMVQQDVLRHQAVQTVVARLSRMEPPLRKEVVEYMSDADVHLWSMRRSKANFFRLMSVFSSLFMAGRWFGEVCEWKNPVTTMLVHILFIMLVCFPELILPTVFLYMFMIGLWNFRFRPHYPPHMNTKISYAEAVMPDELDEEFDTFPTTRNPEIVRMRYDRLRHVAGRIQTVVGDIATQGERTVALLSWRDPRATAMFTLFCLVAAIVLYVMPVQVLMALGGFYVMRHPRFRRRTPSVPVNFFRRLPTRTDSML